MQRFKLSSVFLLLVVLLSACSSTDEEKTKITGERIAVLDAQRQAYAVPTATDVTIMLPQPAANPEWPQVGGVTTHAMGHLALSSMPKRRWSSDIGAGASGSLKILSQPIVASGRVYAMDAKGKVLTDQLDHGAFDSALDLHHRHRDGVSLHVFQKG